MKHKIEAESPSNPSTPKKPKVANDPKDTKPKVSPKNPSSAKSPNTSSASPSRGTLSTADKRMIIETGMDILAKQLPFKELSEQLGVPESRLRDQFKPNPANLRRDVEELFK